MILVVENLLFKNEVNYVYDSRYRTNKKNVEQLNAKQEKKREKYYEIIFKQKEE